MKIIFYKEVQAKIIVIELKLSSLPLSHLPCCYYLISQIKKSSKIGADPSLFGRFAIKNNATYYILKSSNGC